MDSIGAYEAKTHLPRILERVAKGEKVTITTHGAPVALIVPVDSEKRSDPQTVISERRLFRTTRKLGRLSLKTMIAEGRRF